MAVDGREGGLEDAVCWNEGDGEREIDSLLKVVMHATDALLLTLKSMFRAMGRDRLAIASKGGPSLQEKGREFCGGSGRRPLYAPSSKGCPWKAAETVERKSSL